MSFNFKKYQTLFYKKSYFVKIFLSMILFKAAAFFLACIAMWVYIYQLTDDKGDAHLECKWNHWLFCLIEDKITYYASLQSFV